MSTKKCRDTNCPHYQWLGAGMGGADVQPTKGRCVITKRMVNRMKECPLEVEAK
jgi:hypothetical protein